ncbi:sushi, von Willebrand factor type A, EGF and pentraxin domain-containing protein 1-like isoform X2 [Mytilus edulis]|uniref:sushi, von Willebrand factor type A, EGF and pentraxin domain-containing protein 1-like isoform X2 n=1 Tax=Mytilus edulis TaxID=6550 RepID=UPI0039EE830C
MLKFWLVFVIVFSIYHETNAIEKLTRQCMASQGKCAQTKKSNCESSFGSGWTEKGSCCRRRPCCVFQCEDIPTNSLTNGAVIVTERNVGSTANFTCDAGLSLVGRKSITCTTSGWDGKIPHCIKMLCPEMVAYFGGSKYIFKCNWETWINSEANCNADGGHLASIETAEENTFLLDVIVLMQNTLGIHVTDPYVLRSLGFYETGHTKVHLNTKNMSANYVLEHGESSNSKNIFLDWPYRQ